MLASGCAKKERSGGPPVQPAAPRAGREPGAPDSRPAPPAPAQASQPAASDPRERAAADRAREVYASLERGDVTRLDPLVTPRLVDVLAHDEAAGLAYYWLNSTGQALDWQPLIRWARLHPSETIREVRAFTSPHQDTTMVVVIDFGNANAFMLVEFRDAGDHGTIAKVFLDTDPLELD